MSRGEGYDETMEDLLRRWDEGESVWTIEMGGLGPGYEQAIQVTAIELGRKLIPHRETLQELLDRGEEDEGGRKELNAVIEQELAHLLLEHDETLGGLSGAQAGAVKQIAFFFVMKGVKESLMNADEDRMIQVSNHWPRLEEKPVIHTPT